MTIELVQAKSNPFGYSRPNKLICLNKMRVVCWTRAIPGLFLNPAIFGLFLDWLFGNLWLDLAISVLFLDLAISIHFCTWLCRVFLETGYFRLFVELGGPWGTFSLFDFDVSRGPTRKKHTVEMLSFWNDPENQIHVIPLFAISDLFRLRANGDLA